MTAKPPGKGAKGRRRIAYTGETIAIQVRVSPEELEVIDDKASRYGVTRSAYLYMLIRENLKSGRVVVK